MKDWSAVARGMKVELVVANHTGKPFIRDITKALTNKYGIKDFSSAGMSESIFEFTKG